MKKLSMLACVIVVSCAGMDSALAQGSGTTAPAQKSGTSAPAQKSGTTAPERSSFKVSRSVSGTIAARNGNVISVKIGSQTRGFNIQKSTKITSAKGTTIGLAALRPGQTVRVAYSSKTPKVASSIRVRG